MALNPSAYITGIIFFTLFVMGGVAILGEFNQKDSTFTQNTDFVQFNKTFDKYSDLVSSGENLKSTITESQPENSFQAFGIINGLVQTAWNALKTIFSTFSFMDDAFEGAAEFLNIPVWIVGLITTLVVIGLVFSIYQAIFQARV